MVENQASSTKREDVDHLWFRLKEAEMEGLEGIYIHFAPALFQNGLTQIHDPGFVQDCIQEVFLEGNISP